ncbi:hypothetical protein TRFO_12916 [Tritrichomonas foetus]|uniref:EF-hand domain-containing protein n=1 Tax=Tritrichomonas foetus TaxID=1144522 RepID=A0A1J4KZZ7_9EUKA|nr:hypothetical protein TRFO_12916 [Tritrichomonas foetus]|eukprot:OHT16831.1 hypothetical protein TRFO_12916 [Tritrichomonas foetus]
MTLNKSITKKLMNQVAKDRRTLRHEILKDFVGIESKKIFEAIKREDLPFITFNELVPYCQRAKIPVEKLTDIFSLYEVFKKKISPKKFINFLEDEVTCKTLEVNLNPKLTDAQIKILTEFAEGIKNHRTTAISLDSTTERSLISNMWIFVVRYNPANSNEKYVRLASLCRIAAEINLSFSTEDFIEAVFTFFDKRIDQLDFTQFVQLMQAFS